MSPRAGTQRRAVVIGAGVGGLSAAARLAHAGFDVDVLEKQSQVGGRCGRVTLEAGSGATPEQRLRYTFDLGPTILLMPFVLARTFEELGGRRLSDYLKITRCDPSYRLHWRDGGHLTLGAPGEKLKAELERLEPGSYARFEQFLAQGQDQHDTALERFVGKHFASLTQLFGPSNLGHFFRTKAHKKLWSHVGSYFQNEKLKEALSFQTMYLGVSPYEAPAIFSLLPYTEAAHGIWYPEGGLASVSHALAKVCGELGVRIHLDSPVSRIGVGGGRARNVTLADGRVLAADVVVCNADWAYAEKLLPDAAAEKRRNKTRHARFTSSGVLLYWGLNRRVDSLLHHNVFFGKDFGGSFKDIFERGKVPGDLSFYVNAPAHTDASMAPEGHDALYVLVPVPSKQRSRINWAAESLKIRAAVLKRLSEEGHGDIAEHIVAEKVLTPDDWERELNLMHGANYGLAQNLWQVGPFRPKVWDEDIEGLYYCGASVQPGTGVPTVMESARLMVEALLPREGVPAPRVDASAEPRRWIPNPGGTAA